MKRISYFSDRGLSVHLAENEMLGIDGLNSLQGGLKDQVIQYANDHKWEIVFELKAHGKTLKEQIDILWQQANELADWVDDPHGEPLEKRQAKVPEVMAMSEKLDELMKWQAQGVTYP